MQIPTWRLQVETRRATGSLHLVLSDDAGLQIATHDVVIAEHPPSAWESVFQTRTHIERYAETTRAQEEAIAKVGAFLGAHVLGSQILEPLSTLAYRRVLEVHVPQTDDDVLAAALARVPWEIARAAPGKPSLEARRFVIHVAVAPLVAASRYPVPTAPAPNEAVRVLLVFVDQARADPLAMRRERETLLRLFYDRVMPRRRVHVDVLCHGVSRASLRNQVRSADGYHVIHWSGHGDHNQLALDDSAGGAWLSGEELAGLLIDAGGFLPHLIFFNTCLSGALVGLDDWRAIRAALQAPRRRRRSAAPADVATLLGQSPGYSGTALTLLTCGVPQVVAMRYEVCDTYARNLAVEFYRALFQDDVCKSAADALDYARAELRINDDGAYEPLDHVTPLFLGRRHIPMPVPAGRSTSLAQRFPRPQPLLPEGREMDRPERFVGRALDLMRLRQHWLEGTLPVALIQGLPGLGKTTLAAEAMHLWHTRFDGVFCFQFKPEALALDGFLRRLDERLSLHSRAYRERTDSTREPYARVYLPEDERLRGEARDRVLRDNLLAALRDERLLLVLDNFETQLGAGTARCACIDPRWDALLEHLADGLGDSLSRVLVTSRQRPAVLAAPERCLWIALGPLPANDALLIVQEHHELQRLFVSDELAKHELAQNLLDTARGHPLILERLARLAGEPQLLSDALEQLRARGLDELPSVLVPVEDDVMRERERAYLEDIAGRSIDIWLEHVGPEARRVAQVLALGGEPVTQRMLGEVWQAVSGTPLPQEGLRRLLDSGLITRDDTCTCDCHELVRERVNAWFMANPNEASLDPLRVRQAYGHGSVEEFLDCLGARQPQSAERAVVAGRRAVRHLTAVRDVPGLARFGGYLVTATHAGALLSKVAEELRGAASAAEPGQLRWTLDGLVADALRNAGRPDEALGAYKSAVRQAARAHHWEDLGWLLGAGAQALRATGRLAAACGWMRRALWAKQRAGVSPLRLAMAQTEQHRLELLRGRAGVALPKLQALVARLRSWWQRQAAGERVPEAPEPILLGRALVSALDAASQALAALHRWPDALELLKEQEALALALGHTAHDVARIAFNIYEPLMHMERVDEAQQVAERCLDAFRAAGDAASEVAALGALAEIWCRRGDPDQALALGLQTLAQANRRPEPSARAAAHVNLSNYLEAHGQHERAARHLLASLTYDVLTDARQELALKLHNVAACQAEAVLAGRPLAWPRLHALLDDPEFAALGALARSLGRDLATLQAQVDEALARAAPLCS